LHSLITLYFSRFLIFLLRNLWRFIPDLPEFDMGTLMPVLMGMLGLGGLRTFEKAKGISK
jgi:hypothetical protein